jgi:hypothetical protein
VSFLLRTRDHQAAARPSPPDRHNASLRAIAPRWHQFHQSETRRSSTGRAVARFLHTEGFSPNAIATLQNPNSQRRTAPLSNDGAIAISAANPMMGAAQSLLASGAPPDAMLSGSFEGAAISAVALSRLARVYVPPRTNHRLPDVSRNVDA